MRALFGRLLDGAVALWRATLPWRTGAPEPRKHATIPPPRGPRSTLNWPSAPPFPPERESGLPIIPVEFGDEEITPVDRPPSDKRPTLPRHNRKRPPLHDRKKP